MRYRAFSTGTLLLFITALLTLSSPHFFQNLAVLRFNHVFAQNDAIQAFNLDNKSISLLPNHLELILNPIQYGESDVEPYSSEVFLQRCQSLFATQELKQAIPWCQMAADVNPLSSAPHLLLGRIYLLEGNVEQEIQSYRNALQIDPSNSWAYYYLGTVLEKEKDYSGAIDTYTLALNNEINDFVGLSNFYHRLGLNYHYLYSGNESDKTKEYLDRAVELNDYKGSGETQESTLSHRLNILGQ